MELSAGCGNALFVFFVRNNPLFFTSLDITSPCAKCARSRCWNWCEHTTAIITYLHTHRTISVCESRHPYREQQNGDCVVLALFRMMRLKVTWLISSSQHKRFRRHALWGGFNEQAKSQNRELMTICFLLEQLNAQCECGKDKMKVPKDVVPLRVFRSRTTLGFG